MKNLLKFPLLLACMLISSRLFKAYKGSNNSVSQTIIDNKFLVIALALLFLLWVIMNVLLPYLSKKNNT